MEEYLTIKKFETYSVSNYGNVRNNLTGRILKPGQRNGYYQVVLSTSFDKPKTYQVHRIVATTFLNNPENKPFVDHIDGNPKNNHLSNLRFVTVSENNRNTKIGTRNTSGTKGVSWDKQSKKWRASLMFNHKTIYIDKFDKLEDAIIARKNVENEYFGEFQRFKSTFEKLSYDHGKLINEIDILFKEIDDMKLLI